jgi:glycerol-3-phosphate acyltransferase PlsX
LGLNGLVIKSHGGTDARGFANAMRVAARLAASSYMTQVSESLLALSDARAQAQNSVAEPLKILTEQE